MRKGRDRKYASPAHNARIKAIWLQRMKDCENTPEFMHACAITCFELSPMTKFDEMPDAIRFARIPDSVTSEQLNRELMLMGFDADKAAVLSAEPRDFTIQGKRRTLTERNKMIEKGLTYAWRKTKQAKTENI